ncbi:NAD-binding protein [Niallia sp. XMNu-256]|uniref:potassium channel family protein n=1 Tax=Niallia sp. XMNu-256 TaxID=3082444 RepID=UPI0030D33281
MPSQIYLGFIRLPLLLRTFIIAISSIIIFGIIVHFIEPDSFPTIFDGIWWAIITASTVGYGDFFPSSIFGRLAGILLILSSAGFLSSFFVALATTAATRQNDYLEGKAIFRGKNHYIIVGWNERSKEVVQSLLIKQKTVSITLIDASLTKNPLPNHNIHFVKGVANQDSTLLQANIENATKVIITADTNLGEMQADMNSILTLLAVKGLNPNVETIIEILTNDQIANAKRAGADEIIQTNILTSFVIHQSINSQDMVTSFLDLLYQLSEEKITFKEADIDELNKDYTSLGMKYLEEGMTLLGVKRGGATILNPPKPFAIEKKDQLILIT